MLINKKGLKALKKTLGKDFIEKLEKSEIYKVTTNTVLSPDEIRIGLQIVPKTVLQWLFGQLKQHSSGFSEKIKIPFEDNAEMQYTKNSTDNYSGTIYKDDKVLCEFKNRSIPGIGLLILTSFELYDKDMLSEIKQHLQQEQTPETKEKEHALDGLIHQKLLLHQLVEEVVNKKLSERDAIDRMIREKLNTHIVSVNTQCSSSEKKSKLAQFMENVDNKKTSEEVKMGRAEISCPDCKTILHKKEDENIKLCLCYGDLNNTLLKLKKTQNGSVKISLPKSFDAEDVAMLLEAIRNKQGDQ